ncbi:MAG: methyltransferase domain-containing protein [Candidatus Hydrogenedens sp.]|nr:methyltransferase domain-containing protein [Candidatus Hydrogenedens sp.]
MTDELRPDRLTWTEETIGRYWRWQAGYPDQYFTLRFGARIVWHLRRWLHRRRRILDYGCGVGFLVPHLAGLGAEVTATDFSPAALAATTERARGLANFMGAVPPAALIAAGRTFDAIVSVEVIEHLTDPHLESFFGTLKVLLAPDGVAIVTTPNQERLGDAEIYCPCCNHTFHRWQHLRSWSAATLGQAARTHGFEVSETIVTDFALSRPGVLKRVVKRLLRRPILNPHLVCVLRHSS